MSQVKSLEKRQAEGRSPLWKLVDIVEHNGDAKLKCKACQSMLSAINPSQIYKQHFHDDKCLQSKKKVLWYAEKYACLLWQMLNNLKMQFGI